MTEHELKLKPAYVELQEEFEAEFANHSCSCHISAPCSLCIHEGNPTNLIENEDAWYHLCPECSTIMLKKGIHFDCPHCGFTTCASC